MRDVILPKDLSLLVKWMHQPHIIPQWQLNKPELELAVYFERMLCDDHQHLYIVQIDGKDVGYLEIYEAKRDRLALYYDAKKDDLGWHVLLSEDAVGQGHFRAVMRMLSFLIFEHSNAEKVVGEPDQTMSVYEKIRADIALEPQGTIQLQEKKQRCCITVIEKNFISSAVIIIKRLSEKKKKADKCLVEN